MPAAVAMSGSFNDWGGEHGTQYKVARLREEEEKEEEEED